MRGACAAGRVTAAAPAPAGLRAGTGTLLFLNGGRADSQALPVARAHLPRPPTPPTPPTLPTPPPRDAGEKLPRKLSVEQLDTSTLLL